jgi:phosphate transport system permease protein
MSTPTTSHTLSAGARSVQQTPVPGMSGFLVFRCSAHLSISRSCGALSLLCRNFSRAIRLFEDAPLTAVPRAGGATRWCTICTVVLPSALPGLITGVILTAGKILGEAAALFCTMGLFNPASVFAPDPTLVSDTLTTCLYSIKGVGAGSAGLTSAQETALAAGISAILMVLLLLITFAARCTGRRLQRKLTAA